MDEVLLALSDFSIGITYLGSCSETFKSFGVYSGVTFCNDGLEGGYGSSCALVWFWDEAKRLFYTNLTSFLSVSISFYIFAFSWSSVVSNLESSEDLLLIELPLRWVFSMELLALLLVSFLLRFFLLNFRQIFMLLFRFKTDLCDGLCSSFELLLLMVGIWV